MKKKQLSNKEVNSLNEAIKQAFNVQLFFAKKDKVELWENEIKVIARDNEPLFVYIPELIPTLKNLLKNNFLKVITINMPAVKFIVNGADIMRPGIVAFDTFSKDQIIAIVDQNNKKPLAVGKALVSSDEMKVMDKGKVVKNLHRVGDEIWSIGSTQ